MCTRLGPPVYVLIIGVVLFERLINRSLESVLIIGVVLKVSTFIGSLYYTHQSTIETLLSCNEHKLYATLLTCTSHKSEYVVLSIELLDKIVCTVNSCCFFSLESTTKA